ncbi:MAG: ABC transporter permease [Actinobacteria bacterium]|nr:ABC transporter permease [Actinomycetota bacterium]
MHKVTTTGGQAALEGYAIRPRRRDGAARFFKHLAHDRLVLVAAIFLALVVLAAVLAPLIAAGYGKGVLSQRLLPPAWSAGGSFAHLFGTDEQGRDVLARMMWGGQVSLRVGFVVVALAGLVGIALGLIAGLLGGTIDSLIMRAVDVMFSMPGLLIALVFILVLGPGERNLIIALAVNAWMVFTRLVRGLVLAMRDGPLVEAAHAVGVPQSRIMWRHILPNILGLVVTISVLEVARIMLAEAVMSFLGYGIQPPAVSWGSMIGSGRNYVSNDPWLVVLPGLALALTVLALNVIANWLRTEMDPLQQKFDTKIALKSDLEFDVGVELQMVDSAPA